MVLVWLSALSEGYVPLSLVIAHYTRVPDEEGVDLICCASVWLPPNRRAGRSLMTLSLLLGMITIHVLT